MPTMIAPKIGSDLGQVREESQEQTQLTTVLAKTSAEKDADTRQRVALMCVVGYFVGLALILIGVPLYNYAAYARASDQKLLLDLKDTLLTYQAVVGTLVGAVVAYYFKTKLEEKETDK